MTRTWNYRITFRLTPDGAHNVTVQNAPTYEQAYAQAERGVWFGFKPIVLKREIEYYYGWTDLDGTAA